MSGGDTTTTTTQSTLGGPTGRSDGERPPSDVMVNEMFFDKKCGVEGTRQLFYENCMKPSGSNIEGIKCKDVHGSSGVCDVELQFLFDNETTTPSVSADNQRIPTGLHYKHVCSFGPGKTGSNWEADVMLPRDRMQEIIESCRQELFGPPPSLPLWLILLIIFLVIAAVSITAFLFWRYWLRQKLYGRGPGNGSSSFGSFYTSAPFSSRSAAQPSSGVRPLSGSSIKQFSSGAKPLSSRSSQSGSKAPSSGGIRSSSLSKKLGRSNVAQAAPTIRSTG